MGPMGLVAILPVDSRAGQRVSGFLHLLSTAYHRTLGLLHASKAVRHYLKVLYSYEYYLEVA